MATITKGHVGDLEYIPETTEGSEPTTGTLQIPSDSVTNVTLTGTNNGSIVYTINDYDGQDTVLGLAEYTLTFDYTLQLLNTTGEHVLADTIEYNAMTRTTGQTAPLTFYYTTASGVRYMLCGAKCQTLSMTSNSGETITVHAEYWSASCAVTNAHYADLTPATAIANNYEANSAVVQRPDGTAIAYGVGSFSFTVSNNCSRVPSINSRDPKAIMCGKEETSGSIDILVDNGGTTEFTEMMVGTENTISFETGSTASASEDWEFTNAIFTNFPMSYSADDAYVVVGVSWISEGVTLAAYSS